MCNQCKTTEHVPGLVFEGVAGNGKAECIAYIRALSDSQIVNINIKQLSRPAARSEACKQPCEGDCEGCEDIEGWGYPVVSAAYEPESYDE